MTKRVVYTIGGSVQSGDGVYITRRADKQLLQLCQDSQFAYVLAHRQCGKSSLMHRTAEELIRSGVRAVRIDLSGIGTKGGSNQSSIEEDSNQLLIDQWYFSLLTEIEDELSLTTDVVEWWQQHAELFPTDRLVRFFREVVLREINSSTVIFLDEIDTTLEFNFRGDFFAALRYLYQDRARHPELNRLSFVLIGVAIPSELINDPQRTPFNIGQGIDLTDFTFEEALPLADGLGLPTRKSHQVLHWVLDWTGGHPFLTQGLCQALVNSDRNDWSKTDVDAVVHETFLGAAGDRNPHLQFIRRFLLERTPDVTAALTTYQQIRNGWQPVFDEEQSSVKSHLKLSGIVRRDEGRLKVRNRIYRHVFNNRWINENLPLDDQIRKLRRKFLIAAGVIAVILPTPFAVWAEIQRRDARSQKNIAEQNAIRAKENEDEARRQTEIADRNQRKAQQETRRATVSERNALEQTRIAQVERYNAQEQAFIANQQRQEADKQRDAANREKQTVETQRQEAELREMAARALNLLSSQNPTDGLVQAIATIQRNLSYLGDQKILQPVQHSLFTSIDTARKRNTFHSSESVYAVAIHPSGRLIANLDHCGFIELWNSQGERLYRGSGLVECTDASFNLNRTDTTTETCWNTIENGMDLGRQCSTEESSQTEISSSPIIGSIVFSQDEQLMVYSSGNNAEIWQFQGNSLAPYKTLIGHGKQVSAIAISADGQLIATGSFDKTIRLWDRQGNLIGHPLQGHEAEVTIVAISPDGHLITSGGVDGTIRLWDKQGNPIGEPFGGHEGIVTSVAFNPYGQYSQEQINDEQFDYDNQIVSGGTDGSIRLWNLKGESIGQPLQGHSGTVTTVMFSPDRRTIISAGVDKTIRLWDRLGYSIGQPLTNTSVVTALALSADGKTLVSGSLDTTIHLWDLQGRQMVLSHRDEGSVDSVSISAEGQTVLGSSGDDKEAAIRLWQLQDNQVTSRSLNTARWSNPTLLIPSPLDIFQSIRPRCLLVGSLSICPPDPPLTVLSSNGQFVITVNGKNVIVGDLGYRPIRRIAEITPESSKVRDNITHLVVSNDNQILGIVSGDKTLHLVDISNPSNATLLVSFDVPSGNKIDTLALSADKRTLAISSKEDPDEGNSNDDRDELKYFLDLFDLSISPPIQFRSIPIDKLVNSLAISSDGQTIAGASGTSIHLWNRQGETIGQPFQRHEQSISSVAISADGQTIVSGSADQTVRVWNREGSEIVPSLRGHRAPVMSVAISADGKTVVSGSEDRTVRLWQIGNWQDWLQVGCNRLHYHPVFQHPENSFDPAVTQEARKACEQLVWHRMNFGSR